MSKRFNIRMAGVGGQGVVTGSHILSTAVINAGGESTIVPFYGSEKRMAPVESYVRVSDEPIFEIGEITFPHIIIIFHPQVITHGKSYTMPFYFGLKEDGVALINNDGPMKLHRDQARELEERRAKLYYFPATKISLEVAGMDLATNMALMGSIGAITGLTSVEALEQALAHIVRQRRVLDRGLHEIDRPLGGVQDDAAIITACQMLFEFQTQFGTKIAINVRRQRT